MLLAVLLATTLVQSAPRIATDGDAVLVVWREQAALRASLDGKEITIASVTSGEAPAVTFTGSDWIVAYAVPNRVVYRRISRDGVVSPEMLLSNDGARPLSFRAASSGDGHFVLVWHVAVNNGGFTSACRIRASIDGKPPVEITHDVDGFPDVTWDGISFRLIWINCEWRSTAGQPGLDFLYTANVGLTEAFLSLTGGFVIADRRRVEAYWPRVSRDFALWNQGSIVVKRGSERTVVKMNPGSAYPPAFAADDSGHALAVFRGGRAVLVGSGDPETFIAASNAVDVDVVWTKNGWVLAYTQLVDGVSRVFVKRIEFAPQRRRSR